MNHSPRIVCCTFDVDFTDYVGNAQQDELETAFPLIRGVLEQFPEIVTTWFIRIDSQVETIYGSALYAFEKHAEKINWLQQNGHEIGWHHHAYRQNGTAWEQETNVFRICDALMHYGSMARAKNITAARMGWGQHTNETMQVLATLGFKTDSSAVPRPDYSWDKAVRDWSITGQDPYYPAEADYRRPGDSHLPVLEIPMATVPLPLPGDTEPGVIRYINPAYHPEVFRRAMENCSNAITILITHPYECIGRGTAGHAALAFDVEALRTNFRLLAASGFRFKTISTITHE